MASQPFAVMDGDGADYYEMSRHLMTHGEIVAPRSDTSGFTGPTATRPPLYLFFGAATLAIAERALTGTELPDFAAVLLVQAVLDTFTTLLVMTLTLQLVKGPQGHVAALFAGFGYGVNSYVSLYTGLFLSETLFIFLQTASLVAIVHAWRTDRMLSLVGAGVLLGLAALTRPVVLFFPLVVAAWWILRPPTDTSRNSVTRVATALVFLLAFVLTLSPWMIRNRIVMGKWITISTVGGQTFYRSNHLESDGQWKRLPVPPSAPSTSEADLDGYYYREGIAFVLAHPSLSLKNAAKKVLRLYYVFYPQYDFYFGITFLLAIPGVWLTFRAHINRSLELPLLLIAYTTLLTVVFWGTPRFRAPLIPCFLIFAALYCAQRVWPLAPHFRSRHVFFTAAVCIVNVLLASYPRVGQSFVKSIFP
ncbi:MAG: glycosyltransferase family 39 protein [Deltaproteobacteria bacterium]|nr:glycosyltransferase family 39 protein [Deltaproteobacteria bacterium]